MTIEDTPRRPEPARRGHLAVDSVTFSKAGTRLLSDISFEAAPGSTTLVVGANSEAQTALLELLLGLRGPSAGTVSVDGATMAELPSGEARSLVAIALRDPWLTAGTVAENIAFGLRGVERIQIENAAKLACVDSFTKNRELGLDTMICDEGSDLTAGQRRLIALARAVLRHPAVLLIEEPTSDLTALEETTAIRAVRRVREGRTTVVVTNRATMAGDGDEIIRIDRPRSVRRRHLAVDTGHELAAGFEAVSFIEQTTHTETWLAWAREHRCLVHLKVPRRTPATSTAREELACEYRTSVLLRHSGLARPIEAEVDGPRPFAAYEHIDGPTLADIVGSRADGAEPSMVLRTAYELARTLSYFHQRRFAHLDLRPEIAVLSRQGTVLTDLRMALPIGRDRVSFYRPEQFGTVAPEQLRGAPASAAMDIFALGVLMYQAASGILATTYSGSVRDRDRAIGPRPPKRRPAGGDPNKRHLSITPTIEPVAAPAGRHRSGDLSAAVSMIIEQLTVADPDRRPTAEEAVSLIRPYLFPAPAAPSRISPAA